MGYRRFPAEFKAAAVKLVVEQGVSAREAAGDLGIKITTLLFWVKQHRRGQGPARAQEDLRQQVKRLQAEVDRLRTERDILKKAAAYFAQDQRP
jgi:transposase